MNKNYTYSVADVKKLAEDVAQYMTPVLGNGPYTEWCIERDDEIELIVDAAFEHIPDDIEEISIKYARDLVFESIRRTFNTYKTLNGGIAGGFTCKETDDTWKIVAVAKLLSKMNICRMISEDPQHPYLVVYNNKNGIWAIAVDHDDIDFCEMVYECVPSAKKNFRAEIFTKMKSYVKMEYGYCKPTVDGRFEMYGNGVWDYQEQEIISFEDAKARGFIFTRPASTTKVNLNATVSPIWHDDVNNRDMTFEDLLVEWLDNDADKVSALWDAMHGMLRPHSKGFKKAVYIVDTRTAGNNGKSTLSNFMIGLIGGDEYVDGTCFSDLGEKGLTLAGLVKKSALISAEDDTNPHLKNCKVFKALVVHDTIQVNQKYKDVVAFKPYLQTWFVANGMPNPDDKSDSITKRMYFIDFNTYFDESKANPDIENFLAREDVKEYVLNKLIHMNLTQYKLYPFQYRLLNIFKEVTNPVASFLQIITNLEDRDGENVHWDMYPYQYLYDLYNDWYCLEFKNCVSKIKKTEFITRVETWIRTNQAGWECTASVREPDKIAKVVGSYSYLNNPEFFTKDFMFKIKSNLQPYLSRTYAGPDEMKVYKPDGMPTRFTGIYRTYTYKCKTRDEVYKACDEWKAQHDTKANGGNKDD